MRKAAGRRYVYSDRGSASGGSTVVVPVYLGEIAPTEFRGLLGTAFQVTVTISMFTAQVLGLPAALGTKEAWPFLLMTPAVPCIVQLALNSRLVESPRWLASHGYEEQVQIPDERI